MVRLRTVSPSSRGWTRRRRGAGFSYVDDADRPLAADEVARIRSLAIPPAWREVWICAYHNGHLQAVGTDDAGRRQYLHHPDWRVQRDPLTFDRVLDAAHRLVAARRRITRELSSEGMPLERATAVAVRLLDQGDFRIGSDAYAEGGSFVSPRWSVGTCRCAAACWWSGSSASRGSSTRSRSTTPR